MGKHNSGYMYCTYRFTALFEAILCLLPRKQHGRQTTRSHVCDFSSNTSAHARWYANLNRDFRSPSVNQKRLVLKLSIYSPCAARIWFSQENYVITLICIPASRMSFFRHSFGNCCLKLGQLSIWLRVTWGKVLLTPWRRITLGPPKKN